MTFLHDAPANSVKNRENSADPITLPLGIRYLGSAQERPQIFCGCWAVV